MSENTPADPVASPGILDLFTVANEFCLFTEKAEKYNPEEVLLYYARICPMLYLKGALLPELEEDEDYYGERFVNEDQWESIFNSLQIVFAGKDDFYTLSYSSSDTLPLKASLAEHLADIYQDLKDFVILYSQNRLNAKHSAVRECRTLFATHWGSRIAALLPALHTIAFPAEPEDELLF
jgi:hypothetical protein